MALMDPSPEERKKMTVTLNLSPEAEQKVRELAAQAGTSVERFIERHVEELARRRPAVGQAAPATETWEEVCAPLAAAMQGGEVSDDELAHLVEEAREEVWQEKQGKAG
jgi:hypothetical protein